jgi:hypothetical protein
MKTGDVGRAVPTNIGDDGRAEPKNVGLAVPTMSSRGHSKFLNVISFLVTFFFGWF